MIHICVGACGLACVNVSLASFGLSLLLFQIIFLDNHVFGIISEVFLSFLYISFDFAPMLAIVFQCGAVWGAPSKFETTPRHHFWGEVGGKI